MSLKTVTEILEKCFKNFLKISGRVVPPPPDPPAALLFALQIFACAELNLGKNMIGIWGGGQKNDSQN